MPDIASTDVAYVELSRPVIDGPARTMRHLSIAFGDGALTYPAGGVPLDNGQLGMGTQLDSLLIEDADNSDGFLYKYDRANNKIRIYQGDNDNAADAPLIELVSGVATPAATTLTVEVKGR